MTLEINNIDMRLKSPSILFFLFASVLFLYVVAKRVFLVKNFESTLNEDFYIKIRATPSIFSFVDNSVAKSITVINKKTKCSFEIKYLSEEYNVYFYVSRDKYRRNLKIVDEYAGCSTYDYDSLRVLGKDCFSKYGTCSGYSKEDLKNFGNPNLVFDEKGLHR